MRQTTYLLQFFLLVISSNKITAQCGITVDAGPDQYVCAIGETATLQGNVTGNFLGFVWTPAAGLDDDRSLTPNATVNGPMTYTLTGFAEDPNAPNLVVNPDFQDGNTGFFSDFIFDPLPVTPGTYTLTTSPSVVLSLFPPCDDHTSGNGTGNMMLINGTGNPANVWCEIITVNPNSYYVMSGWVASAPLSPPPLQFSIDGDLIGSPFQASGAGCVWEQFSATWFSGPSTSIMLCLTDQSTTGNGLLGDFFALDDMYFAEACSESDDVMVDVAEVEAILPTATVLPCNALPGGMQLDGSASTTGPNITYQWTTGSGNIVSGENTLTPTVDEAGVYTLTAAFDNGTTICEDAASIEVLPDPNFVLAFASVSDIISCTNPTVIIDGGGSSSGPTISYEWSPVAGIISGETTQYPEVVVGGTYTLLVTNSVSGCTATTTVEVAEDTTLPSAEASAPGDLNCMDTTLTLSGMGSSTGFEFSYEWTASNGGHIVSGETSLNDCIVDSAGVYQLTVTNDINGCTDTALVNVNANINLPMVMARSTDSISCVDTLAVVLGDSSATDINISYLWTTDNGHIVSDSSQMNIMVGSGGAYILTVSDSNSGCEASDTVSVFENTNAPVAVAVAVAAMPEQFACLTDSLQLDGTGSSTDSVFTHIWTTMNGVILSGDTTLTPFISAPGGYYLTVRDTSNGCVALDTAIVLSDTLSPIAEAGNPVSIGCDGGAETLDGNGSSAGGNFTHLWTTVGGNILSGDTTLMPEVNAAGTYFITTTNTANGCASTDSVVVAADGNAPFVFATVSDSLDCGSLQLTIDGSGSSTGPNISISWETVNGNFVSGETTLMPIIDEGGTYILTLTNTSNNCTASTSVVVMQDTLFPQISIAQPDLLNCYQPLDTLDALASSQGPVFSQNWTTPDGHIVAGETTYSPIVDAAGVYILTLSNSVNGCSSTDSVTVQANFNLPVADAGVPQTIGCVNSQATLDGMGSSQGSQFNYLWTTQNGNIISGEMDLEPMVNMSGTYILTVENAANGCVAVDSVMVQQAMMLPDPEVSFTNVSCNGLADGQASVIPSGGFAPFSFEWSNGDTTAIVENLLPGMYDVTVYDANNCQSTGQAIIEQPNILEVELTAITPAGCGGSDNGTATVAAAGGTPGYSFLWSNGDTTQNIENLAAGIYTVTVSDTNNCMATLDVEIVMDNTIDLEMPMVLTQDIKVELDANGMATISVTDIDNGSSDNCGIESMSLDATNFNCDQIGENIVILSAMDASGNTNSASAIVTVVDNTPPLIEGCPDNMVLPFCDPVVIFDFTATDNCSTDISATQINGLPSGSTFPIGETTEQVFEATDVGGNSATCTFDVTVVDSMTVTPSVSDVSCFGEEDGSIAVAVTGGSPDYTYMWSNDSTGMSINNLIPGIYSLTITDDLGCESVQEYEIMEPSELVTTLVNIVNETNNNADGKVDVTVTGGMMPYTYQWVDINGNPIGDMEDIDSLSAGTYQLFATDANDCVSSSAYTIQNTTPTNNPTLDALIKVFPNPTYGWLMVEFIDLPIIEMNVTVHDVVGQTVFSQKNANVATGKYLLDFSDYAEGVYLLKLTFNGQVVTKRVVKVSL